MAETRATQARWLARQGRAADKDFEEAAQAYQQAIESTQQPLDYLLAFGRFYREWGAWRQRTGLDPRPLLERGLELAGKVLAARPTWAEALRANPNLKRTWEEAAHLAD